MADNFWKRKIVHYRLYQRCGRGNKTTYRALFYCKASQKTWDLTPLQKTVRGFSHKDMLGILYELKESKSKNELKMDNSRMLGNLALEESFHF